MTGVRNQFRRKIRRWRRKLFKVEGESGDLEGATASRSVAEMSRAV